MNNEIVNALETLAAKLGTTSEYLWGVLLKQAPITAVTDFIQYTFIVFAYIFWFKKIKVFAAKISNNDWEEENWIWIIVVSIIFVVSIILGAFAIAAFFSFPNTIYALINPEYWALDRILSKLQ